MHVENRWNARLYDGKMDFVSRFGKGVLEWLQPQPGETILDLGCGTGDLCAEMAKAGAVPTGMDLSADMIDTARSKYPALRFFVANAETFVTEEPFDAVFSNAALHWIKRPEAVIRQVWLALKPGGRFVAEFGGAGNVERVVQAIRAVLADKGRDADSRNPWYFPGIGAYTWLLERQGFVVKLAHHFERPTPLPDGEQGLRHWLDAFCGPFFADMPPQEKDETFAMIADRLRPALFRDGSWVLDYNRIRVAALKPHEQRPLP
jgi:trans-aconitate methyltransferase